MSVPYDTPTQFQIAVVEKKRELPAKPAEGDKPAQPAKAILKLGLVCPDGETKTWADLFSDINESAWPKPGSSETFILTAPKQEGWNPTAKRPRSGGGGGPRRRDPAETRAIQRQHSQEMAIRALALYWGEGKPLAEGKAGVRAEIKEWTDWFEQDISA